MPHNSHIGTAAGPLPKDWIPSDPQKYTTTTHFDNRAQSTDRVITRNLAAEVITRDGEPKVGHGNWFFAAETQGLEIHVYGVIYRDFYPAVNTGFARVTDFEQALCSDRWTRRELICEHVRTELHGSEEPWSDDIRQLEWDTPIHVKGHPLVSEHGDRSVWCHHCDETHGSWAELKETEGQHH